MKARKFIKRDRKTVGRGTGTLMCRLYLPATGEEYDWRTTPTNPTRAVGLIRKFVERHISKSSELLKGANFVIEAEIRETPNRLGRKKLAEWKFGEELSSVFEKALKEWQILEFEEDWAAFNVEI
jgi:hypothetical protein